MDDQNRSQSRGGIGEAVGVGGLSIFALLARLCTGADDVARVAINSGDEAAEVLLRSADAAGDAGVRSSDDAGKALSQFADASGNLRTARIGGYGAGANRVSLPGYSITDFDIPPEDLFRLFRNRPYLSATVEGVEAEIQTASLAGDIQRYADDAHAAATVSRRGAGAPPRRPFDWSIDNNFNPLGRGNWPEEDKWVRIQDEHIEWKPLLYAPDPGVRFRVRRAPPKLLSFLPDTEKDFIRVFGHPWTESSRSELEKALAKVGKLPRAKQVKMEFAETRLLAWQLEQQIDDSRFVVILGHSEDEGRVLVFPSGQRVAVADIHRTCAEVGSTCLVLTCYGDDFGLTGKISASDALHMWDAALSRHSAALDTVTPAEFAYTMRVARGERITRHRIVLTASIGSSGAILWVATSRQANPTTQRRTTSR